MIPPGITPGRARIAQRFGAQRFGPPVLRAPVLRALRDLFAK
jgi:hypothetical protein